MTPHFTRRTFLTLVGGSALASMAAIPLLSHAEQPLTIAEIKKAGVLRVGVEAAYVPFTFRKEGAIVGYDIDLADIFCKTLGVKPEIIDTAWAGVIPSLDAGKFDIIMSAMSYTAERVKRVGFSIPYAEASQAMLVRAGDEKTIRTVTDLNGLVVAVKLGSPGQILQEKINVKLKADGGPGIREVKIFDDHPAAYLSLAQGKVDVVLNTIPTLAMVLKDAPGKYAIVKGLGADNWAGIATRAENTEVIAFLNQELTRLKADGTLNQLQEKWFGFRMTLADKIPDFSS